MDFLQLSESIVRVFGLLNCHRFTLIGPSITGHYYTATKYPTHLNHINSELVTPIRNEILLNIYC